MANVNAPFGFRPVKHLTGAPYNGKVNKYSVDTAAAIIGVGDWVKLEGSADSEGYPTVERAASDDAVILGVVVAVESDRENLSKIRIAADEDGVVFVADAPDLVCEVQTDADGFAAVDTGLVATVTVGDASATTGKSTTVLDMDGANGDFRVLNKKLITDNAYGAYAVVEGVFVQHLLGSRSVADV